MWAGGHFPVALPATPRARSDADLKKIFAKFGEVRDVYLPKDYATK